MKTTAVLFGFIFASLVGNAQTPSRPSPAPASSGGTGTTFLSSADIVSFRNSDSEIHETIRTSVDANGRTVNQTNRYTVVATGMNVQGPDGKFTPASAEIEIDPAGGAVAQKTRHRIEFNADIVDGRGAARFTIGDKTFVSRPLGISYFDTATGKSVLISEFRSTIATLAPGDNKIVWKDCSTDFKCNLIIENQLSGMDQCLEILECPPAPADFGLNNNSTRLELITEFFNPPAPVKMLKPKNGADDDLVLDFGAARMTIGKAFKIGDATSAHVTKHWTRMDNRDCLIEQVQYSAIQAQLATLPQHPTASRGPKESTKRTASLKRILPERKAASNIHPGKVHVAALKSASSGVILDYTIISADSTDYVFQGGTTYFVTNLFTLSGTTVIEGGTIIKFSTNSVAELSVDALDCRTGPYSPAIFTSMMDNSVGDSITGSTGNPWTNYCGDSAFYTETPSGCTLSNVRFCHLNAGLTCPDDVVDSGLINATDIQVVHCNYAFRSDCLPTIRNGLFDTVNTLFGLGLPHGNAAGTTITGENLTIHHCGDFAVDNTGAFYFTNCLIVQTTNFTTYFPSQMYTNDVVVLNDDTGVFESVGAGNHYLADDSPYRGAGTTNGIDGDLLASLQNKTTYAPILLTNAEFSDVTLNPSVGRDSNGSALDIGYHYDPIDYFCETYTISNAVLTVTNGTVIAYPKDTGVWIADGSTIISQGSPFYPNRFVSYQAVQEQSIVIGSAASGMPINPYRYSSVGQPGIFRFTQFNRIHSGSGGQDDIYDGLGHWLFSTLEVKDCTFTGGGVVDCEYPPSAIVGITNNLFERAKLWFMSNDVPFNLTLRNNLLHGGSYTAFAADPSWTIRDNIFDSASAAEDISSSTHDHNAYINTSTNNFPTNTGDIVLTNFTFVTGPLGSYYQPTNSVLIDAGSQYATNAGLFHYTTTTNQVIETNTVVDIGLHYVAVNSSGDPLDTDGDGVPDYLEDPNGNGTVDSGETDWKSATDLGLKVLITSPQDGSNLP